MVNDFSHSLLPIGSQKIEFLYDYIKVNSGLTFNYGTTSHDSKSKLEQPFNSPQTSEGKLWVESTQEAIDNRIRKFQLAFSHDGYVNKPDFSESTGIQVVCGTVLIVLMKITAGSYLNLLFSF